MLKSLEVGKLRAPAALPALPPRRSWRRDGRVTEESAPRRNPRIALLLWILPLWLVVSAGFSIWFYFRKQASDAQVEQIRFATAVNDADLKGDVDKFLGFVGQRHPGSPQGLNRAAAMIEGSLGPANAGYKVERLRGPTLEAGQWPLLLVTLRGREEELPPLWIVVGYDGRPGSLGAEANASGVASAMAAAHALADAHPKRAVVFAFIPHAYDSDSPLADTFAILKQRIGSASSVLVVEAMGAGEKLMVSSRDAENPALRLVDGLGEVAGAETICMEDDFDLSSALFEMNLPAVRVATRPVVRADEADDTAPDSAKHAAATRALVSLIEKLSDS
ncbi:hypothetical protein OJ996_08790 [Luteolibacter sp. GHJ8]|uniref:Peptidase M28 domain-containing protein n=1 Tax=Luteolibacter rhizosphaerae TaxID=2989719 RepID=A0ABT3G361_9BACT|nr:M28 family peptidase [Luteolibacter rhizosphaerae]MCW1913670.1 hypothetical protein [Luteolibacter rhizosphaerae]